MPPPPASKPRINVKDPKVIVVAVAVAALVWFLFLRSPKPPAATSQNVGPRPDQANPAAGGGSSGETGSSGTPATDVNVGLLSTLAELVDASLQREGLFSQFAQQTQANVFGFASSTQGQVFDYAARTNQNLTDITTSVLSNPPTNTVLYYGVDTGSGGNTSTAVSGGTPAPPATQSAPFTPSYSPAPYTPPTFSTLPIGTGGLKQVIPVAKGPVSPPVVPAYHGLGLGGPQA